MIASAAPNPRLVRPVTIAVLLASLAAVLYVPYFIPQKPVASDSYVFGYNNRAAVVLLVALCCCVAVWVRPMRVPTTEGQQSRVGKKVFAICLGIQLAACVAMVLLAGRSGGFGEARYEIDRVWLLTRGHAPYKDFEWPFGVAFLYGPVWIARLLHCGVVQAYSFFWVACSVGGIAILYAVIERLDFPSAHKRAIFALVFALQLPWALGMGVHYTLVRFMTPFYSMLVVYEMAQRERRGWHAALAAMLFVILLLLISPEMAVAFAFACGILLFPAAKAWGGARLETAEYAVMLTGFAVAFGSAWKLHVFDTMIASGGGADSFPIPFAATVVFFFAVVLFCFCVVTERMRGGGVADNGICLIAVALPLLPAALGRCDPGHITCDGLGFLMAGLLYCSASARMWRWGCACFLVAMVVVPDAIPFGVFAVTARRNAAAVAPVAIDFDVIYPGAKAGRSDGVLEAPFGYRPDGWGSYLSPAVDYGFYEGIENANTPQAVARKVAELAAHPQRSLLIPRGASNIYEVDGAAERRMISIIFAFPYYGRVVHPVSVRQPLRDFIADHYSLVWQATPGNFEYELWMPKQAVAASTANPARFD